MVNSIEFKMTFYRYNSILITKIASTTITRKSLSLNFYLGHKIVSIYLKYTLESIFCLKIVQNVCI